MGTAKRDRLAWWVCGLALLAGLTAPEIDAAQRTVTASIDEPFAVNGVVFDAGALTLREVSTYNPSTTLTEIWIEDRCLGVMLAGMSDTPLRAHDDSFIFQRNDAGRLVLVGFAYRGQPERELYGYDSTATGRGWSDPPRSSAHGIAAMMP